MKKLAYIRAGWRRVQLSPDLNLLRQRVPIHVPLELANFRSAGPVGHFARHK